MLSRHNENACPENAMNLATAHLADILKARRHIKKGGFGRPFAPI